MPEDIKLYKRKVKSILPHDKVKMTDKGFTSTHTLLSTYSSSPRQAMSSGHATQIVTPASPDIPMILSGLESQLSEYVLDIRMPEDGMVVGIFRKYTPGVGIRNSPEVTLIYQEVHDGHYGCVSVKKEQTMHMYFTNPLQLTDVIQSASIGTYIPKGTILAKSKNIHEADIYSNTVNSNTLYGSIEATIEDGQSCHEEHAKRAAPMFSDSVTLKWGGSRYPLNLYGDENNYQVFPNIGDKIRPDGLIFASRVHDPILDAIKMSKKELMRVDTSTDNLVYGEPGATILNVTVESAQVRAKRTLSQIQSDPEINSQYNAQAMKYINNNASYHDGIKSWYDGIYRQSKNVKLSPSLQNLIVKAIGNRQNDKSRTRNHTTGIIKSTFKGIPIEGFMVTLTYGIVKPLTEGSKVSGDVGDKGVICEILPKERAMLDSEGVPIDMAIFVKSPISRLNLSQLYYHYISSCAERLTYWIRDRLNVPEPDYHGIWDHLMGFYKIVSKDQYSTLSHIKGSLDSRIEHINTVAKHMVRVVLGDSEKDVDYTIVERLINKYPPKKGRIKITKPDGTVVNSLYDAITGIRHYSTLERAHVLPAAVSSAHRQPTGLISAKAPIDSKKATYVKTVAPVDTGETESRSNITNLGPVTAAKYHDAQNNPERHREILLSILTKDPNSQLTKEDSNPRLGNSVPLTVLNTTLAIGGLKLTTSKPGERE